MKQLDHSRQISAFGAMLKEWRTYRRISQLDLACEAGISARHLSFIETGRSKPGRDMIVLLAETLDIPHRQQNDMLKAAGYATKFEDTDPLSLMQGETGFILNMILEKQAPYPALIIDRAWNILAMNDPAMIILGRLMNSELAERPEAGNASLVTFHPKGISQYVSNWSEAGPLLYHRLSRESAAEPHNEELRQLVEQIREISPDIAASRLPPDQDPALVLHLDIDHPDVKLKLFTTITTFGTPMDAMLQEVRIESFFPRDEASKALLETLASS